jgi:NADH-quinone oxidoreductase subunit K
MNNILNEIGIENYIFLSTILFCIGVFGVYTGEMQLSYLSVEIMLNAVNLYLLHFLLITKMHKDKFCLFSMYV